MINKIYNEDCLQTMLKMEGKGIQPDIILTSPPYNVSRLYYGDAGIKKGQRKYDVYKDNMTNAEYMAWMVSLFNHFDICLKENGLVILNLSYNNELKEGLSSLDRLFKTLTEITEKTNFMLADKFIWKKDRAIPNNVSQNKLTRIAEDIYILCRKKEYYTYQSNKEVVSISKKTGQAYYNSIWNFIEAKNNNETCKLNKATYSVELCNQLLDIYANKDSLVYDPFIGTGTTAVACINRGISYIGSEISEAQCAWSDNRIKMSIQES